MPAKMFTDRWLRTAGPFNRTMEFVDLACPNLWVRIGKRRKSFSILIGPASHRRRIPIGAYPVVSIALARTKAADLLSDPRAAGGGRPRRGGKVRKGSVKNLFEFVVTAMDAEGKTASIPDYRLYLLDGADAAAKDFGPATAARNVTPEMVTDWLAKFHQRGSSTRLPRAILSAAFNRGIKADNDPTSKKERTIKFGLESNPVANVGGPTQSNTRDRTLSLAELRDFWRGLDMEPFSAELGLAMKLIIAMGGVRITEVLSSEKDWWRDHGGWREFDAPRLALPKTKNGRPHDLPVTKCAKGLLSRARATSNEGSLFLFPSPYEQSRARSFDHLSKLVQQYCAKNEIDPFTPRDIRRSMKTLLLDNDVAQVDVDIWHNHGRNADVARRNYDRAEYEHAKRRVMIAIDAIVAKF